jgi:hypothetical protein
MGILAWTRGGVVRDGYPSLDPRWGRGLDNAPAEEKGMARDGLAQEKGGSVFMYRFYYPLLHHPLVAPPSISTHDPGRPPLRHVPAPAPSAA